MQNHFSVNAAAEMLERTRRTVKRALRNTPPDSTERGQPRWRLPRIIQALESSGAPMTRHNSGDVFNLDALNADLDRDRRTLSLFDNFNAAFEEMKAERSVEKRRAMAISLAPTFYAAFMNYRAHCIASGEFIDGGERAECMLSRLLDGFEKPCRWTHDEAWKLIRSQEKYGED